MRRTKSQLHALKRQGAAERRAAREKRVYARGVRRNVRAATALKRTAKMQECYTLGRTYNKKTNQCGTGRRGRMHWVGDTLQCMYGTTPKGRCKRRPTRYNKGDARVKPIGAKKLTGSKAKGKKTGKAIKTIVIPA